MAGRALRSRTVEGTNAKATAQAASRLALNAQDVAHNVSPKPRKARARKPARIVTARRQPSRRRAIAEHPDTDVVSEPDFAQLEAFVSDELRGTYWHARQAEHEALCGLLLAVTETEDVKAKIRVFERHFLGKLHGFERSKIAALTDYELDSHAYLLETLIMRWWRHNRMGSQSLFTTHAPPDSVLREYRRAYMSTEAKMATRHVEVEEHDEGSQEEVGGSEEDSEDETSEDDSEQGH